MAPPLMRRMACWMYEGALLFGVIFGTGLFVFGLVFAVGYLVPSMAPMLAAVNNRYALQAYVFLLLALYFTWFWSSRGQTLPMQTWNIRLVMLSGQPLSQGTALMRYLASSAWFVPAVVIAQINHWSRWEALLAVTVGVVAYALLALLHPQRQFWHDALCGTQIIDAPPLKRRR